MYAGLSLAFVLVSVVSLSVASITQTTPFVDPNGGVYCTNAATQDMLRKPAASAESVCCTDNALPCNTSVCTFWTCDAPSCPPGGCLYVSRGQCGTTDFTCIGSAPTLASFGFALIGALLSHVLLLL